MKIAFAGKGGAGKTTMAALFIRALAAGRDRKILAVDCDPVANLGRMLRVEGADTIVPIAEMKKMINERMETSPDRTLYKLNPKVDDIPEIFAKKKDNVSLIVMGTVKSGGSGCMCPESNFIKALLGRLLLSEGEDVVMDMEAGVEHLGRGTANFVDRLFIVTEPGTGSIEAAKKIARLAQDLGIKNISAILNKTRQDEEIEFVKKNIGSLALAGTVPFDEKMREFEKGEAIDIEKTKAYQAILKIRGMKKNDI
ncbi:MAG: AAA family ATPase [Candidatus Omnitrophica bacterium]|nr:AAA family ATPase [Candidatus Omnitrophota bacterium]